MMVFKVVAWTPRDVSNVKRALGKLGTFEQLETPKKHITFFVPAMGAETVAFSILQSYVEANRVLKVVFWNFSEYRVAPAESLPVAEYDKDPFIVED